MQIGIVSDTHGLVRPELVRELSGVHLIVHAGDIGSRVVLEELKKIAPVAAVRGNVDTGAWAATLQAKQVIEPVPGVFLYILHDIKQLDLDPASARCSAVIFGHSHRASVEQKDGVWYLNPGGAGPRRFSLPVTLIRATIENGIIAPGIITLDV